jgi:hypothetical protein
VGKPIYTSPSAVVCSSIQDFQQKLSNITNKYMVAGDLVFQLPGSSTIQGGMAYSSKNIACTGRIVLDCNSSTFVGFVFSVSLDNVKFVVRNAKFTTNTAIVFNADQTASYNTEFQNCEFKDTSSVATNYNHKMYFDQCKYNNLEGTSQFLDIRRGSDVEMNGPETYLPDNPFPFSDRPFIANRGTRLYLPVWRPDACHFYVNQLVPGDDPQGKHILNETIIFFNEEIANPDYIRYDSQTITVNPNTHVLGVAIDRSTEVKVVEEVMDIQGEIDRLPYFIGGSGSRVIKLYEAKQVDEDQDLVLIVDKSGSGFLALDFSNTEFNNAMLRLKIGGNVALHIRNIKFTGSSAALLVTDDGYSVGNNEQKGGHLTFASGQFVQLVVDAAEVFISGNVSLLPSGQVQNYKVMNGAVVRSAATGALPTGFAPYVATCSTLMVKQEAPESMVSTSIEPGCHVIIGTKQLMPTSF